MTESIKDFIFNTYLQARNFAIQTLRLKINDFSKVVNSEKYTPRITDFFSNLKHWRKGLWWGNYRDTEDMAYTADSQVLISHKRLILLSEKISKLNNKNGKKMPFATGTIQKNRAIRGYGAFEVVARIHEARGIWHAPLWFVAAGRGSEIIVLPEIDVVEVYTSKNKNKAKAQTNIHYGEDYAENKRSMGARTHTISNFFDRWISFALIWRKDRLDFYYDGILVRRITNKSILKRIEKGIIPIIGAGVTNTPPQDENHMEIKSFRYWAEN